MKAKCNEHATHDHMHGASCGHHTVSHDGHTDYLHDGHMHYPHAGHVDEHAVAVGKMNPDACTPDHTCKGHAKDHTHSAMCGHERVPHGDHVDYLVSGHLHHTHSGHCDNHGSIDVAA